MRTFAIGDTHGNFDDFQLLLSKLEQEKDFSLSNDHLVLLGDLVDSGPQVKQLITWAIKIQKEYPDTFHVVKGNHEDLLLDAVANLGLRRYDWGLWQEQGGQATIASYGGTLKNYNIPEEHINWLSALPVYWETEDYFFVHGGVRNTLLKNIDFAESATLLDLMWLRDSFIESKFVWEKKIVFGHTPSTYTGAKAPFMYKNKIGINTQPRYKIGYLCAVELPAEEIISLEVKQF